ncbi:helix-turn-helix domain-containing protein [Flavobacterium yafengii]|uniref:helix-turn-helix domain-containing protein n=1 Tax=Flavobacterium yafengii TaxID=3041253 RepID=UPI0024A9920B|nr:helix-turn-helix transcriptional regulator [Flavobacterium yafengii]MDI5888485.1 helix-turn-helix transcriptional regulator [Flavobacterium yafengii]
MAKQEVLIDYRKAFGENLKKIREEKIKTLSGVDKKTDFDASNYHKYEKGTGNPTIETLVRIATGLGIHPKDLLDFEYELKSDDIHK